MGFDVLWGVIVSELCEILMDSSEYYQIHKLRLKQNVKFCKGISFG